jgi:hypothetical protein
MYLYTNRIIPPNLLWRAEVTGSGYEISGQSAESRPDATNHSASGG